MAIQLSAVNTAVDTFQNWIDKVNAVVNTIANSVITANTNANGAVTTGNGFVTGTLGATTIVATTLRGGNVQSSANLTIAGNAIFTGAFLRLNSNVSITNSSITIGDNVSFSDVLISIGNSTINLVANSTALKISPNTTLNGSALAIGNSTVNAVVNTSGVYIGGGQLPLANNKATVAINGSLIGSASRLNFSATGSANVAASLDSGGGQINVVVTATASVGTSGGTNTMVLFNDSTLIGGNAGFTYDKSTNSVFIGNTLTIGTRSLNSTSHSWGNSTINSTSNSTATQHRNATVTTIYGVGGANVGANVSITTSGISIGNSTVNTTATSTLVESDNLMFTTQLSGGNVVITTSDMTVGNSTVNTVVNSSGISLSGLLVANTTALVIGSNVVFDDDSFLYGNSTVSFSGNSRVIQVANATTAAIVNSNGLAIGSNVSVTYQQVTVGTSTMNSAAISAASYIGSGIATPANYWSNTAGKVLTTDALNGSGAYFTLTDAATINWDMSTGINFKVTLAGNRILAQPSNLIIGRSGVILVIIDGVGGRTLSFQGGNVFLFDSDVPPSIGSAANKWNFLFYHVAHTGQILITLAAKAI